MCIQLENTYADIIAFNKVLFQLKQIILCKGVMYVCVCGACVMCAYVYECGKNGVNVRRALLPLGRHVFYLNNFIIQIHFDGKIVYTHQHLMNAVVIYVCDTLALVFSVDFYQSLDVIG